MKCTNCPVVVEEAACLGESISRLCTLARTREDYRRELARLAHQASTSSARGPHDLQETLAAVADCPYRGAILPVSNQPDCGCSELTECRSGRGARPGLVTLQDCLACVVQRREQETADPAVLGL
jgi:hypothetical protein